MSRPSPTSTYAAVIRHIAKAGQWRDVVLKRFKALGGNPNRWRIPDKRAMAEALTRTEDEAEYSAAGRMTESRQAMKDIRRQLELETT